MLLVIISHQLIEYILGEHWPPNQLQSLLIGQKHVHWCISPDDLDGRESACNEGDLGSISGSGRSLEEENSYPLKYSCLENSMDRGAWWTIVHAVTKSQTQLSDFHFHFFSYIYMYMCVHIYIYIHTNTYIKKHTYTQLFSLLV